MGDFESMSISFPFYPENLIAGTSLMSNEQLGIYMRLLCHAWFHKGLPQDETVLSQLVGADFIPNIVMRKFHVDLTDGLLKNRRMELERAKLVQSQKDETTAMLNGELQSYCQRENINAALHGHGFPDAWRDWKNYRQQTGKPMTSGTSREVMLKCERWGAKKSAKIIRRAIEFSWINLRDDDEVTVTHGGVRLTEAKESLTARWMKEKKPGQTFNEWRAENRI
jgi:uncharacterized protein YdaU (DUF1376 family)